MPLVADSHHFVSGFADPHQSEKADPDPTKNPHQCDADPQHWFFPKFLWSTSTVQCNTVIRGGMVPTPNTI
jgi:hypothetical protein